MKILTRYRQFRDTNPSAINYGIDGIMVAGAMAIAMSNNNRFASRLGATSAELSMLHFLPSLIGMILLIPAGLFTDSLKDKRRMISAMLLAAGSFYAIVSLSAFVSNVWFFLIFVALAVISINGMYNLAWQGFFPESVPEDKRNDVLTFRARMTMFVSLIVPVTIGVVLTFVVPTEAGRIITHQIFYVLAAVMLFANYFHFKKIKAINPNPPKKIAVDEMLTSAKRILTNKHFLFFTLTVLFFHMTWQLDWTLYFVGQETYLEMNDLMLNLTPVVGVIGQLLTVKYWSRKNTKWGVDRPLTLGILGLSINPVAMIVGLSLPAPFGIYAFLFLHFVATLTFSIIILNVFQSLLKVADTENRSLSISIYTCLIMASNAVMPRAGVWIYETLGGHMYALRITFVIAFFLRILAAGLWWVRVKHFEKTFEKNIAN